MRLAGKWSSREVWMNGRRLSPRRSQRVWNHSPDGFNWSYEGSGPAQLALAILLRHGLSAREAVTLHQAFKRAFIARLPPADFVVDIPIAEWLAGGEH